MLSSHTGESSRSSLMRDSNNSFTEYQLLALTTHHPFRRRGTITRPVECGVRRQGHQTKYYARSACESLLPAGLERCGEVPAEREATAESHGEILIGEVRAPVASGNA